jgi:hypothetical protein
MEKVVVLVGIFVIVIVFLLIITISGSGKFDGKPTQNQIDWRNLQKTYEQMTVFRESIVKTGTAKQLIEFDVAYNSLRNCFPSDFLKAIESRYVRDWHKSHT